MIAGVDAVTLAVVSSSLRASVGEMRSVLVRTAYSSTLKESADFSCGILDAEGRLLAMGDDNPIHIFPVPMSVRAIIATYRDIAPGDAFLHNDPYTGGTHLNDVTLVTPMFFDRRRLGFAVARAHWSDVGGMVPGSISGAATEIFQEGFRIPAIRVMRNGELDQAVVNLLFANMRLVDERRGDLGAMVAAGRVGARRVEELAVRYGASIYFAASQRLIERTEAQLRQQIRELPDGVWQYDNYLDPAVPGGDPLRIRAAVRVDGEGVTVDFTGTSRQVAGPTNAGPATAMSAVASVLKGYLTPFEPTNHGLFAPVQVINPAGSILHAAPPAACGGNAEVKRATESALFGVFAQMVPRLATGDLRGTSNHLYIAGETQGRRFVFYEYPVGGNGAFLGGDGASAIRGFTEGNNPSIQPVESLEAEFPLRVERCELHEDSGGPGRWRGGLGIRQHIRVLVADATLSVLSDKNVLPPFGVCGGEAGAPNRFGVLRDGEWLEPSRLPGKVSGFPLNPGDVVVVETAGGGGYGDPHDRPAQEVAADIALRYVSGAAARARFGVAVTHEGAIDRSTTDEVRRPERRIRLECRLEPNRSEARAIPLGRIHPTAASRAGAEDGGFAELIGESAAPVRLRVCMDDELDAGTIQLNGPVPGVIDGGAVRLMALPAKEP